MKDEPDVEDGGVTLHLGLDEEVIARWQEDHHTEHCHGVVTILFTVTIVALLTLTLNF